jgi:hypothetical protein
MKRGLRAPFLFVGSSSTLSRPTRLRAQYRYRYRDRYRYRTPAHRDLRSRPRGSLSERSESNGSFDSAFGLAPNDINHPPTRQPGRLPHNRPSIEGEVLWGTRLACRAGGWICQLVFHRRYRRNGAQDEIPTALPGPARRHFISIMQRFASQLRIRNET